jgi:O-antigen ligase
MAQSSLLKRFRSEDINFWSLIVFLTVIALTGGSSRATSAGHMVTLAASTLAAAGWLSFTRSTPDRRLWPAFAFIGACAAVICLQLIPLPPAWWEALPGRKAYAIAAIVANPTPRWRPISLAPDLSWSALFTLLIPAALTIGLSRLSSHRRSALMLPVASLIFVSGVLGLAQVTGGPGSALRWYGGNPDPSAVGFLANRNHQALLLACALPILAAVASIPASGARRHPAFRWGTLGVGAFFVLMLPTTGSRAGIVLTGVAILMALAIAVPSMRQRLRGMRRRQRRRIVAGSTGAVLLFAGTFAFLGRNVAFSRISSLDPMSDLRVRAFPVVADITRAFFPFGTGVGTFDPVFRHFEPFNLLKLTYFNQAHNDIAQAVLEGGAPAAALLIAFVAWWVVATIRAWRAPTSIQALAARAGSSVILLCLLASIVDYPLRTSLVLSIFSIAAIWLLTPMTSREGP